MKKTLCRRRCLLKIPKNYTGFKAETNVFAEHNQPIRADQVVRNHNRILASLEKKKVAARDRQAHEDAEKSRARVG